MAGTLVAGFAVVVVAVADFDALAEAEAEAEPVAVLDDEAEEEPLAEADALPVAQSVVLGDAVADWLADVDVVPVGSELWLAPAEPLAGAPEAMTVLDMVEEADAVAVAVHVTLAVVPEAAAAGNDRTVPYTSEPSPREKATAADARRVRLNADMADAVS